MARVTKAQVNAARNRLGRAWRKLEKARAMKARLHLKVVMAEDRIVKAENEKAKALANLDRVESIHNRG